MTRSSCRYCGSDQVSTVAWGEWLAERLHPEETLIFDGAKPIPRELRYCASCGYWLPSSGERTQTEELIAALRLVASKPDLAGARLEHGDKPDIRMHLDGHVFGLEVTRIARGGEDAISNAQWRRAVERTARLLMRRKGNPPVWVSVHWLHALPRSDMQGTAQALAEFAEQQLDNVANVNDRFLLQLSGRDLSNSVARYVSSITLAHAQNGKDDNWTSGFANNPEVQPRELQDKIDDKALKVGGYADRGDGLWLLVYAESSNAAQALDITDEARAALYSGPFDRVFFLDCMDKAGELQLAPSAIRAT
jgi:hypothetical protein